MAKKKDESAATLERFERGLRRALSTPAEPHRPLKRAKRKKKRA